MPVSALFNKGRVVTQILQRLVFNYQQAAIGKQFFFKDDFGDFRDFIQIVRRVGKYQVVLLGFYLKVFKNILFKNIYRG